MCFIHFLAFLQPVRSTTPNTMILISKPKFLGLIFLFVGWKISTQWPDHRYFVVENRKNACQKLLKRPKSAAFLLLRAPKMQKLCTTSFWSRERKTSHRTAWIIKYVSASEELFFLIYLSKIVKQQDDNKSLQFGNTLYRQAPLCTVCSVRKKIIAEEENNSLPFEIQSRWNIKTPTYGAINLILSSLPPVWSGGAATELITIAAISASDVIVFVFSSALIKPRRTVRGPRQEVGGLWLLAKSQWLH